MSKYSSKSVKSSFKYAMNGLGLIYKSQRNIKIQILFALFAVIFAFMLEFTFLEYVILFILIMFVLSAEMVNTVFEFILDSIYKHKYSRIAKIAKDMSAGMVLFVTTVVIICGIILYTNKYFNFISGDYLIWY